MAHKDDSEKLTAWAPVAISRALRRNAKKNGRTLSGEIRLALATWVANMKGPA